MIKLQKLIQLFSRFLLPLFFKIEIKNQERVSALARPLIILANHKSYADHFILAVSFSKSTSLFPIRPVAKASLFESLFGLSGKLMEALGAIRNTNILQAIKILKNNGVILIYPEGGIRPSPGIHNMEEGAAFLAIKTAAWILPVAISGLENFSVTKTLLNPFNVFKKRRVMVSFGYPFRDVYSKHQSSLMPEIRAKLEELYKNKAV